MTFEEYLVQKKIDAFTFSGKEPQLYNKWKLEFEQMHPNSFTAQKLYLINPIRRNYPLKVEQPKQVPAASENTAADVASDAPKQAKPVIKPRPKIN